jgi:hypothetical protein
MASFTAPLLNLGAVHFDLPRSNAELEESTGEVADEEDDGVTDESETCEAAHAWTIPWKSEGRA